MLSSICTGFSLLFKKETRNAYEYWCECRASIRRWVLIWEGRTSATCAAVPAQAGDGQERVPWTPGTPQISTFGGFYKTNSVHPIGDLIREHLSEAQ